MKTKVNTINRRKFISKALPVCALACCSSGYMSTLSAQQKEENSQDQKHKFDADWDRILTHREKVAFQYRNLLQFIKVLKKKIGEEELIEHLETYSEEVGHWVGKQQLARAKDNNFQTFVSIFRPPNFENSLTHEIVQDTETIFELKVTECIYVAIFEKADLAGKIGNAAVCNMDYYWPSSFNPKIRMERSKTLMQGDDHCNHQYICSK